MIRSTIVTVLLLTGILVAQEAPQPVKPIRPSSYREVGRYLHPDGDFYLYLNSDQAGRKLLGVIELIEKAVLKLQRAPRKRAEAEMAFAAIRRVVSVSGLTEMRAMGKSSVQHKEDLHCHRVALYHGAEPVRGVLWKMIGGTPHTLAGLTLMPENTVVAFSGDLRVRVLWEFVTSLMTTLGPEGQKKLNGMREGARKQGLDLDAMMASFAGEATVVVTMDPTRTHPLGNNPRLQVPDLSIMLALTVENDLLYQALSKAISHRPKVEKTDLPGATALTVREQAKAPIRWWPTVAKAEGLLFLATNPDVVEAALNVRAGGQGLAQTEEFARLGEGLPAQGNQMSFVSRRITEQVKHLAQTALEDKLGAGGEAKAPVGEELLEKIGSIGALQTRSVTVHHQDALVTYANSSASLADLTLIQSFIAPAAMMAGVSAQTARQQAVVAQRQARAMAARRRAQEATKGGGREFAEGRALLRVEAPIRRLDANSNVTVEEDELETGFLEMLAGQEESYKMLLKLFDGDTDGALGAKESQAVRTFVFGLVEMLLYDPNRDWKLDEPESDKAWEQWTEAYERHNDHVLKKFDRDRDGALSQEEAKTAREQLGN